MKHLTSIEKNPVTWFLFCLSFVFFLLRLPSFFEPYWYGDEGIYEVIGYALNHGRFLYQGIWDNKPPFLYLIYGLFDGSQQPVRIFSFLIGVASIWVFFFLSKLLFKSRAIAFTTTAVYAFLLATPILEGNIANAENFMVLPTVTAGLLVAWVTEKRNQHEKLLLFLAGMLLSCSFLLKVVGVFDMGAFTCFLFIILYEDIKHLIQTLFYCIPIVAGFVLPIFLTALFFILNHAFSSFIQATLFSNVGYVNYGNQVYIPFTHHVIPQGFLLLKTVLLLTFAAFLFLRRTYVSHSGMFVWLWLAFALYSALFSGRGYTHYILIAVPSFSLFLGTIANSKKMKGLLAIIGVVVFAFCLSNFPVYNYTFGYYQNFLAFAWGNKNLVAYRSFFDKVNPRDYDIAAYINTHRKQGQRVFLWGNSGQIYRLTNTLPPGRFIVAYHMTMTAKNYAETQAVLLRTKPDLIVIFPNQDSLPYSLYGYQERLVINGVFIYEHAF